MSTVPPLYKTTLVIWSDYDASGTDAKDLVSDAHYGDGAYVYLKQTVHVEDPKNHPEWDGTNVFDEEDGCIRCDALIDDGEGYDGLCGNCADREEEDDSDEGVFI